MNPDLKILRNNLCFLYQVPVISFPHIREPGPYTVIIFSDKGIGKKIYMISDYHDIAYLKCRIYSSGSIGKEKTFYAEIPEYPYRQCHQVRSVSFIIMEPSLHGDNLLLSEIAIDKLSFMTFHGRDREIRDILIIYFNAVFNFC